MYKTHKRNFKEKWEIFAWCMHDFLSTWFDLPENPQHIREKVSYQEFVWGKKDTIEVNGMVFKWPHESKKNV
jgi:hypothetical protein